MTSTGLISLPTLLPTTAYGTSSGPHVVATPIPCHVWKVTIVQRTGQGGSLFGGNVSGGYAVAFLQMTDVESTMKPGADLDPPTHFAATLHAKCLPCYGRHDV